MIVFVSTPIFLPRWVNFSSSSSTFPVLGLLRPVNGCYKTESFHLSKVIACSLYLKYCDSQVSPFVSWDRLLQLTCMNQAVMFQ